MTCKFATYTGNPKKINKTLSFTKECSISAYEDVDDLTCDFIILGTDLHGYNYMEVDWNGHTKYYFIGPRIGMQGGKTRIRATCDVLTTYKDAILGSPAVLNRTSDGRDGFTFPFLKDNRVTTLAKTEFSSDRIVSNVIGDIEYVYVGILQKTPSSAV